jgi:hypothetical protein
MFSPSPSTLTTVRELDSEYKSYLFMKIIYYQSCTWIPKIQKLLFVSHIAYYIYIFLILYFALSNFNNTTFLNWNFVYSLSFDGSTMSHIKFSDSFLEYAQFQQTLIDKSKFPEIFFNM